MSSANKKAQDTTRRTSIRLQAKDDAKRTANPQTRKNVKGFDIAIYPQQPIQDTVMLDDKGNQLRFTCFQRLPIELRQEILTLSLPGPRTIEFFVPSAKSTKGTGTDYERNMAKSCLAITLPALLHCSHESRSLAQLWYKPCFSDYTRHNNAIYMDFENDTILISLRAGVSRLFRGSGSQKPFGNYYLKLIKNLALAPAIPVQPGLVATFSGLQEVAFVQSNEQAHLNCKLFQAYWARQQAEKRKKGGSVADLRVENMSAVDFQERFGWDGREIRDLD